MQNLLVMKFGGTSMGSAERIRVAAEICTGHVGKRPLLVVVSAMSKITDLLLDTLRRAEAGVDTGAGANLREPACGGKLGRRSAAVRFSPHHARHPHAGGAAATVGG